MDWVNIRNNKIRKMNNCACNATCQRRQVYKRKPKGWLRDLFLVALLLDGRRNAPSNPVCYVSLVEKFIEIGRSLKFSLLV